MDESKDSRDHEPQERAPAFGDAKSETNGRYEAASPPGVVLVAAYSSTSSEDDRILLDGAPLSSPPVSRAKDSFPRPQPLAESSSIWEAPAAPAESPPAAPALDHRPPNPAGHVDNGSIEIPAVDTSSSGGTEDVGSEPSTSPQPPQPLPADAPAAAGTAPGASPSATMPPAQGAGTPREQGDDGKGSAGGGITAGSGDGGGGADGTSSSFGRVSVMCRFRRFGDAEAEKTSLRSDWLRFGGEGEHESGEGGTVSVRMGGVWSRRGFDKVFKPGVEQVEVKYSGDITHLEIVYHEDT